MRCVLSLYPNEISDSYYHSKTVVSSFCYFSSGKGEHRGGSPRFGVRSECGTITEAGSVLTISRRIEDDSVETKTIIASSEPRLFEPNLESPGKPGAFIPLDIPTMERNIPL